MHIQTIEWRCTWASKETLLELLSYLEAYEINSDEYNAIIEDIRCLPNFPYGYSEEYDEIIPVVT